VVAVVRAVPRKKSLVSLRGVLMKKKSGAVLIERDKLGC
jgi:hypothetical protein